MYYLTSSCSSCMYNRKDDLNNNYYDIGTGPFTNYLLINNFDDAF